ncbi:MAG TPA: Ig-like domain-containing protein, partial [Ferruginibacter sp.]|nr:Ig-like domain-containing protein [Ferruginibacter sp.]
MVNKFTYCLLAIIIGLNTQAQFTDNFNDGNFTANPAWIGGTSDFIVNAALQLQSNNTTAGSNFYLATASTKATVAQWDFYCQFTFNTSGANYTDVYLTASASDLTQTSTTGYFVRIGNTDDEISLYRKDAGVAAIKIIDGSNGSTNTSNNTIKVRVIRNAANQWTLSRDLTGTGTSYTSEGVVTDATYLTSAFFGIWVRQSTASFFQRHFFDDIAVTDYAPDVTPPVLQSATPTGVNTVDVLFNEPVELTSSQVISNYVVNNGLGSPLTAVRDGVNTSLVHLTFANNFPNRINLQLTVNGVKDLAGNTLTNGTASFSYFTGIQYDIL